ncbi:threonine ammonia-lyase IlvA [Actinoalloteichus sp. GBA129-24]|uniref:threonine ammonia-lyase IlvA n=1 Tax=Actinoalloteichus sp. GBA129-24 TaxID=1612551 RepID=UPI0009508A4C|nr:threonine ammonia-lyase IlvA [Actinoalloteichus sp. GBA129-24]APU21338.1 L-threonine ammonia-lyase [Actinoalloteichus sp. GBA129-24]
MNPSDISRAADVLRRVVRRTPLEPSARLSAEVGVPVLLKREDLQVCRSYKVRGAYHLISSLSTEERRCGVVCASAGNHGQGVAYSCSQLGIPGRVYLPATTPSQKRGRIAALGGDFVTPAVAGRSFDDADLAARRDSMRTGAVLVHPFDDDRTVAGQGTVAVEITEQCRERIGTVIVPVGGGGLIAGMLLWLKHRLPDVHVVGAEPAGAASMRAALSAGGPVSLTHLDPFVDGAAVARVGRIGYEVVRDLVDELVLVPEGAVCVEMVDLYQTEGIIAEPAGALACAAARMPLRHKPKGTVVCVLSGGNNDIFRYSDVLARARQHAALRSTQRRGRRVSSRKRVNR